MIVDIPRVVTATAAFVMTVALVATSPQISEIHGSMAQSSTMNVVAPRLAVHREEITAYVADVREAAITDLPTRAVNLLDEETKNVLAVFGAMLVPPALVAAFALNLALPTLALSVSGAAMLLGYLHNRKVLSSLT